MEVDTPVTCIENIEINNNSKKYLVKNQRIVNYIKIKRI